MKNITYEGAHLTEEQTEKFTDVRVVMSDYTFLGNAGAFMTYLLKEVNTFSKINGLPAMAIKLKETDSSFVFTKDDNESFPETELSLIVALNAAATDYVNDYVESNEVNINLRNSIFVNLYKVCENGYKMLFNPGGVIENV